MRFHTGVLLFALASSTAFGTDLLTDDFESGSISGSNWSSNAHGQVVADPLNAANHVLNFTALQGGGDLFSVPILNVANFYLSFDYLYRSPDTFGGGFIGNDDPGETWLAGDCNGCFATFSNAMDSLPADTWNHVQIQFTPTGGGPLALKLEQFQGTPGNAFFDNITLSDSGFGSSAPEPSTAVLVMAGVAAAAMWRRRRVA